MTPTLDAVRREELRKLAEAATPGEWLVDPDDRPDMEWNNHIVSADNPELRICFMTSDGRTVANAAYIAAMSPDTTLALLARIAELEAGLEAAAQVAENYDRQPFPGFEAGIGVVKKDIAYRIRKLLK